jgi:hypothetical protein
VMSILGVLDRIRVLRCIAISLRHSELLAKHLFWLLFSLSLLLSLVDTTALLVTALIALTLVKSRQYRTSQQVRLLNNGWNEWLIFPAEKPQCLNSLSAKLVISVFCSAAILYIVLPSLVKHNIILYYIRNILLILPNLYGRKVQIHTA